MRTFIPVIVFAVLLSGISSKDVGARPVYFEAFKEKYASDADSDYGKLVAKTKCAVCHPKSDNKKERNAYGMALSKVVTKNEKNKAKVGEALGKIEEEKSPGGKTFGELIKDGKLPGEE
ncbi:MAG TPA: hypothetical protein VG826_03530 [Pirellulales bacterium]|nr:hypothetical protein [Pirellulales bacterium]